jgi:uncharacterized membrane protein YeiB
VHPEAPRIVGVDAARGLAVLGMFVAHAIPRASDAELFADGRSSILFATLAGVSLGIMTGADRPLRRGARGDRMVSIILRALILFLLGIGLSTLGSGIAIILDFYAIMFLLLLPMLFLPRWGLGVVAVILLILAPALASGIDEANPTTNPLLHLSQYYLLLGRYPVLIWLPFLLAGLICARSGLERTRTQVWMMAGGLFSAMLGYGGAEVLPGVTSAAHSGSTAEVVGSGGLAIAIIGALLWLMSPRRAGLESAARTILWPVAAAGSMALTVYTAQVLTLAVFAVLRDDTGGFVEYPGWPLLIGMTLVSLVSASLWRHFLGRGPLERVLTILTRSPRPGRAERSDAGGGGR